jgi:hypothetical protein
MTDASHIFGDHPKARTELGWKRGVSLSSDASTGIRG